MKTIGELRRWLAASPDGATVPCATLATLLAGLDSTEEPVSESVSSSAPALSWREKLWTAPAETRIGKTELLEAFGKTTSWLYRHTSKKSGLPTIPHRKLDGELVFVVGELRVWLRQHEEIIEAGPTDTAPLRRVS